MNFITGLAIVGVISLLIAALLAELFGSGDEEIDEVEGDIG